MKTILTSADTKDAALAELIDELSRLVEAGDHAGAAQFVDEHPGHADALRRLLPAIEALASLDATSQTSSIEHLTSSHPEGTRHPASSTGVLGDFRIVREIGRGGMGVVYEAQQLSLNRRVALKVLPLAAMLDGRRLERFRHEAQAAAMLRHPHIVTVYSVGCERGVHYYAMDYVEGPSLAEVAAQLRAGSTEQGAGGGVEHQSGRAAEQKSSSGAEEHSTNSPTALPLYRSSALVSADTGPIAHAPTLHAPCSSLPAFASREYFRSVARLGIQAAEALDYAHQMGVVHRDIKPSNLLVECTHLAPRDELAEKSRPSPNLYHAERDDYTTPHLWITDFGLAMTQTDAGLTMTGDLLGTLRYMSPEQAAGRRLPLDHRTDIYSLGITLYELVASRPAFDTTDRAQLVRAIAETDPPPLRKLLPAIPADLETIIHKAMEKEAVDRYATAEELADDLRRFVEDRSITARRPSLLALSRKWVRRNRAAATIAAIAAVLLMMLGAALAADRWRQVREATRFVETSLHAARTALAANDVNQAVARFSEAQARIDADQLAEGPLLTHLATLRQETKRYPDFLALLEEARFPRTAPYSTQEPARKALALYGVLDNPGWLDSLRAAGLPDAHITRVVDGAYEALLLLADDLTRWSFRWPKAMRQERLELESRRARGYLNQAISFHAPSRGYYWLLANCATHMNEPDRAARLRQTALESPVQHPSELHYIYRDRWWGTVSKNRGYPEFTYDERYKARREMLHVDPTYYNALFRMATDLSEAGRPAEALPAWYGCLAIYPHDISALANRSSDHLRLGHYDEALADAERALKLSPDSWRAMNGVAWVLATCPADNIRDGRRAVELATEACNRVDIWDSEAGARDTLAAAYAETGDFESAVKWLERALELAVNDDQRRELNEHLASFRDRKPWRIEVKKR